PRSQDLGVFFYCARGANAPTLSTSCSLRAGSGASPAFHIILGGGGWGLLLILRRGLHSLQNGQDLDITCPNWLQLVGETDARPCVFAFPADGGVRGSGRDGGAFRLAG